MRRAGRRCSRSPASRSRVMSEILVGSISETAEQAGLSEFFIGAIVVAIVGNAAEHWVAVLVARKDKMDLAVNISIGSSAQVALFVAPVLVLASYVIGPGPMPLVFNGFELAALILAALIANQVTQDGESTWFEGLQLLAVYADHRRRVLLRLTRRDGARDRRAVIPDAAASPTLGDDPAVDPGRDRRRRRAAARRPAAVRARPRAELPRERRLEHRLADPRPARRRSRSRCSRAARRA